MSGQARGPTPTSDARVPVKAECRIRPREGSRGHSELGARRLGPHSVGRIARPDDCPRLGQLLEVALLADKKPDPPADLTDAVPDRQAKRVDLEDHLLELSKLVGHAGTLYSRVPV